MRRGQLKTNTLTLWLLAMVLILLVLLGGPLVSVAAANAAQAELTESVVMNAVENTHHITTRFEMALRIWSGNLPAQRGLWRSLALAGRYEEAESAIEVSLAKTSHDELAAMTLGLLRLSQGDGEGALQVWTSLGRQAGDVALLFSKTEAHKRGRVTFESPLLPGRTVVIDGRLIRDLAEAGIQGGHPDVWLYLITGDYYQFTERDYKQALGWYLAGRKAHPADHVPPAYAASLLMNMGRYEESRQLFREAFAKSPSLRDDYLVNIGKSYLRENHSGLAIPEFERAIAIAPDNAEWHIYLGDALLASRQVDKARKQFEEALRLSPTLKAAKMRLERLTGEVSP